MHVNDAPHSVWRVAAPHRVSRFIHVMLPDRIQAACACERRATGSRVPAKLPLPLLCVQAHLLVVRAWLVITSPQVG